IINTRVIQAKIKDYYSAWSFFGINFFRTKIKDSFKIKELETSLMISDCEILSPIDISGKSKIDLALRHNASDPEIKADKSSDVNLLFAMQARDAGASGKKVITTGKELKGEIFDELIIDPAIEKKTIIEHCTIRKLIFPRGGNINSELIFNNCYIEGIENQPHCFEKDVIFLGCTFINEIIFSRSNYKQSLILEVCIFEKQAIFNDLKIEKDLHLSYSSFKESLQVLLVSSNGFLSSHFVNVAEGIKLNNNIIARDLTFRNLVSGKDLELKNNDVHRNLFIKRAKVGGNLNIDGLNAEELNLNDITTIESFSVKNSQLKNLLVIGMTEVGQDASITFMRINGEIMLSRNCFKGSFAFMLCESKINIIDHNFFVCGCDINSNVFNNRSDIYGNLFQGPLSWNSLNTKNIDFNDNHILGSFEIDNIKANNITLKVNEVKQAFGLNNTETNDIHFYDNHFHESYEINTMKADDIYFIDNQVEKNLNIFNAEIDDLIFKRNKALEFSIYNGNYGAITISECEKIGETTIYNISTPKDIKITDNTFLNDLSIEKCKSGGELHFNDNKAQNISLLNTETNDIYLLRNQVKKELSLNYAKSDDLIFNGNDAHIFKLSNSNFVEISILECEKIGETTIISVTARKDIKITENTFLKNLSIEKCKTEGDLQFTDNKAQNISLLNTEAKDITYHNNQVFEQYVINNVKAGDIYLFGNQVTKDLKIINTEMNDLFFSNNEAEDFILYNGNCAEINISKCKKIGGLVFNNVTAGKDISIDDNNFQSETKLLYCKIENDLDFKNNKCKAEFSLQNCKIGNGLNFEDNHILETFRIKNTEAGDLMFARNKTINFEIHNGKYGKISISECEEIGGLICNNISVGKDVSISNNNFLTEAKLLYCKIENNINFEDNAYEADFSLYDNTVNGSILQSDKLIANNYLLQKNLVSGNILLRDTEFKSSFLIQENTVEQQFSIEGLKLNTPYPVSIIKNKFNFVNFGYIDFQSVFYFDQNMVQGRLRLGMREAKKGFQGIVFSKPVSVSENRIRGGMFSNLKFKSAVCLYNNHFEGDLTLHDTDFHKAMDFTGSYIGGSFIFSNTRDLGYDGDLILDHTFIDKRIRFINTKPASFSFKNATFNGFEIPRYWQMKKGRLRNRSNRKEYRYILKETLLRNTKYEEADLPYNLIKSYYESIRGFDDVPTIWKDLQWYVFPYKEGYEMLKKNVIKKGSDVLDHRDLIDDCISRTFFPVYYGFFDKKIIDSMAELAHYFATTDDTYEDEKVQEIFEQLKKFFLGFLYALKYFEEHTVFSGGGNDKKYLRNYQNEINDSLEEQYQVLRHIYGSNGELSNEDKAYYRWMHHRNISEMHSVPLRHKPFELVKIYFI
ncbi:MAG: hypothetical protein HQ565_06750, partial [Bacteroidetes bacterium]|nr:hypothetical protein [Bacteroidota bacterium]